VVREVVEKEPQSPSGAGQSQSESHGRNSQDLGGLLRAQVFKDGESQGFLMDFRKKGPSAA
jgi:hypothetical protein